MPDPDNLLELAERIEAAAGPDRELDAEIAEKILGWRPVQIAPDASGKNSCEVLTPDGRLYGNGYTYPPKRFLHRAFHVPQYTKDPLEALRLLGLRPDGAYARKLLADALRARARSSNDQGRG